MYTITVNYKDGHIDTIYFTDRQMFFRYLDTKGSSGDFGHIKGSNGKVYDLLKDLFADVKATGGFDSDFVPDTYEEYVEGLQYLDKIEKDLIEAFTIADMAGTRYIAYDAWDKELNKIYNLLLEKLADEDAEHLKEEQRLWMEEREEVGGSVLALDGSQAFSDHYYMLFAKTKKWTLELISRYYSAL